MKYLLLPFLLFSTHLFFAQQVDTSKIQEIVNSKISEDAPGLMVGVVKDGNIIYESYRGMANLQHQVKTDEQSRSNIASVAKQFTALCVLKLSLDGKLSLEDDIRKYLPTFYPAIKSKIRIRHLINHTSGVRDYSALMSLKQTPWWREVGMDNDDVIKLLEKQQDLNFEPGTDYVYSNSNYTLLTEIVKVASGQSFHEYSKQLFLELGMTQTNFLKNYMHVIPNHALPYSDWGDGNWQQFPMVTNHFGDGFLFTTLKDQLIFEQALQNASKTNNELLLKSQLPIPNSEITTYGFGLELGDRLNRKAIHHSGGTGSYSAEMIRFPEKNIAIFAMSNNSKVWTGGLANEIAEILLSDEEVAESEIKIPEVGKITTGLNTLIGLYRTPKESIVKITEKEGSLYYQRNNENLYKLVRDKGNLFYFESYSPAKILFSITDNNSESYTIYQPNLVNRTDTRIPSETIDTYTLKAFQGSYTNSETDVVYHLNENNGKLMLQQLGEDETNEVQVLTKNDLLFSDYRMKVVRDPFNRVREILLTTNRLKNIRFTKKEEMRFQPIIPTNGGSINVTTIGSRSGESSQILLTKNYENGNEIWSKQFGGASYDKASSIIATKDGGYLIVGSTSSYGNGNYDIYAIKVDAKGKEEWSESYGDFYNDYGYIAEETDTGYLIKGSKQDCSSNSDVFNRECTTNVWVVVTDKNGQEISNEVRELIDKKVSTWATD